MRHLFRSLKARLFLLVLLAMTPAVGLMLYSANEQRNHGVVHAQQDALVLARSIATEHQRWVDASHGLLRLLSELPYVRSNDPESCRTILRNILEQNPGYTVFGAVNPSGQRLCSTSDAPPVNPTGRTWFQQALLTRSFVVGDYQIGAITGNPVIVFAYPVLDAAGNIDHILTAALNLIWVNARAAQADLPEHSSVTIIDSQGTLVARYPDDAARGQDLSHVPSVAFALGQREDSVAVGLEGSDGTKRIYGVVPFGGEEGDPTLRVLVGIPESEAYAQADETLRRNLVALGFVALIGLLASWAVGERFLLSRVRQLVVAAQRLGIGDFSVRTRMPHDDSDFGNVARAFDQMASSLEAREAERAVAEEQRLALVREQGARAAAEAGHRRRVILYAVSKTLLEAPSMEEAAPALLEEIGQGMDAQLATYWYADGHRGLLLFGASWSSTPTLGGLLDLARGQTRPPDLANRESHIIALTEEHPDEHLAAAWAQGMRWAVRIPLEATSGCLGCMEFLSYEPPEEPRAMVEALTTVGRHIGQFIEKSGAEGARALEENRLRALVEMTPAAVIVVDAESHRLLHVNQEWERFTGLGREAFTTIDDMRRTGMRFTPDGREYKFEELPMARALNKGERVVAEEMVFEFEGGRRIPAVVSAAPVVDANGKVTAAVLLALDITKLQDIERLRSEFLGMVSHELRTPLAIIKMASEEAVTYAEDFTKDETTETFHTISQQVDRLLGLVGNLRDIAQVEAGAFSVAIRPGPLMPLLIEVQEHVRRTTRAPIDLQTPPMLPAVLMDAQRVRQVLENLLNNAVKFSPGGAPVRLWVTAGESEVCVHVTNVGQGIPKEQQAYLFRKFSQLQGRSGSGLGLAISKGIVEAQGGRIWVDSAADAPETTFGFTLRVADAPATGMVGVGGDVMSNMQPQMNDNNRKRVLVVDDEPLIIKHVVRILEGAGHQAVGVTDPERIIPAVQESDPDLVLLDLRLPGTDGFEVFGKLRDVSSAPVIFLSAGAQDADKEHALALGAKDYIVKPVSATDLLARVAAVIGERESVPQRKSAVDLSAP